MYKFVAQNVFITYGWRIVRWPAYEY